MGSVLKPVLDVFRFHKKKMLLVVVFAIVFAVLIFPFGDLSDLVTAKVSQATNGAVYLQFDGLGLDLIPSPGLKLENVVLESGSLPALKSSSLSVSPWLLGLIRFRKGASVDASGLFGGGAAVDFREGEKLKSDERAKSLALDAKGLKLPAVTDFLRSGGMLSLALQGTLGLSTTLDIDPEFKEYQPRGNVAMTIAGFVIPGQTLMTNFNGAMMPIPLPELKMGDTKLDAKLGEGQMEIQSFSFGSVSTSLSGNAKGRLGITFAKDASGVHPIVSGYDLTIDLSVKKEFLAANASSGIGIALDTIKQFNKPTAIGTRYQFRAQGSPNGGFPALSAIQ